MILQLKQTEQEMLFFFELTARCRPAWRGGSGSLGGSVHSMATAGAQRGAGVETCTPIGRLSELGRSSQGRRCGGWAGEQSASSRQSPGTEGRGRRARGGRDRGAQAGVRVGLRASSTGRGRGFHAWSGNQDSPCPTAREGGEAGVHLRAGVYSRTVALTALSGQGQCFRAGGAGSAALQTLGAEDRHGDHRGGLARSRHGTGAERPGGRCGLTECFKASLMSSSVLAVFFL